jgi:SAM-dependent methyltransferase
MDSNIIDIRDFYQTPLGGMFRYFLKKSLDKIATPAGARTLIMGYMAPYGLNTHHTAAVMGMPARMGGISWCPLNHNDNQSVLLEPESLPFPDQTFDKIYVMHCLEYTQSPEQFLKELWRVLTPEGRIIFIVPNRRGLWARVDNSPLGHGIPYTMTQLKRLLNNNGFVPITKFRAIYFPPIKSRSVFALAHIFEWIGSKSLGKFSGIIGIEATKKVYGVSPLSQNVTLYRKIRIMEEVPA